MARWAAFAGIALAVLAVLLVLSRASQSVVREASDGGGHGGGGTAGEPDVPGSESSDTDLSPAVRRVTDPRADRGADEPATGQGLDDPDDARSRRRPGPGESRFVRYGPGAPESTTPELTPGRLLANVALSQGVLAALLLAGAWYARVPASALGLDPGSGGALARQVGVGVAVGIGLAAINAAGSRVARRVGHDPGDGLRELLAPSSTAGWAVLLGGVLPVVAGFEELLFRGALVGAFAEGFGVDPWLLAVCSSVAFGFGHGSQGRLGVAAAALMGLLLAAAFVLTGSLVVVVVAHYLVNAVEFLGHEHGQFG